MGFISLFLLFIFITIFFIFISLSHMKEAHNNSSSHGPKLFFLHLLSIVTLYATAASFIAVAFQLVNIYLPDPLNGIYYDASYAKSGLRTALSFLIIMFPVYVGTLFSLNKIYSKDEAARSTKFRKWLVYLTLFIAALIILFTLVSLVNRLLDGELTLSFSLKLLSIFVVSGGILSYYGWDMKKHG